MLSLLVLVGPCWCWRRCSATDSGLEVHTRLPLCFVLFCFILFCFVLFCSVLFHLLIVSFVVSGFLVVFWRSVTRHQGPRLVARSLSRQFIPLFVTGFGLMATSTYLTTVDGSPTAYLPLPTAWSSAQQDCATGVYQDASGNFVGWDPWYAVQINTSRTTCWPPQATLWWAQAAAAAAAAAAGTSTATTTTATTTTTTILGPEFTCPDIYYPALIETQTTSNTVKTLTFCCPAQYTLYQPQFDRVPASNARQCASQPAPGAVFSWDALTTVSGTEFVYATSQVVPVMTTTITTTMTTTTTTTTIEDNDGAGAGAGAGDAGAGAGVSAWTVFGVPINGENMVLSTDIAIAPTTTSTSTIATVGMATIHGSSSGSSRSNSRSNSNSNSASSTGTHGLLTATTLPSFSSSFFSSSSSSITATGRDSTAGRGHTTASAATAGVAAVTVVTAADGLSRSEMIGIAAGCAAAFVVVVVALLGVVLTTRRRRRRRKRMQLQNGGKGGTGGGQSNNNNNNNGFELEQEECNADCFRTRSQSSGGPLAAAAASLAELEDHKVSRALMACTGNRFVEHEVCGTLPQSGVFWKSHIVGGGGGGQTAKKGEADGMNSASGGATQAEWEQNSHELPA
ncbi:hypothetical protein BD289DRAFT_93732 [Coniella lustricola]|uniref:Membrane-associated protein n=1 Tax=Coniella lustricola TaxID=2025994 RepID=A0A2T2ZYA8_9PEZI|nr:hypothetical protein BD289DRAFT_93732 [Coniella lustricola]